MLWCQLLLPLQKQLPRDGANFRVAMAKLEATHQLLALLDQGTPGASLVASRTAALLELEKLIARSAVEDEAFGGIGVGNECDEKKLIEDKLFEEKRVIEKLVKALSGLEKSLKLAPPT